MGQDLVGRRRMKISTTVDAALLSAVDRFVAQNPDSNRSRVFDEALRLWQACQIEKALEEQYAGPLLPEEQDERTAWRRIRRAAAQRVLGRDHAAS